MDGPLDVIVTRKCLYYVWNISLKNIKQKPRDENKT